MIKIMILISVPCRNCELQNRIKFHILNDYSQLILLLHSNLCLIMSVTHVCHTYDIRYFKNIGAMNSAMQACSFIKCSSGKIN